MRKKLVKKVKKLDSKKLQQKYMRKLKKIFNAVKEQFFKEFPELDQEQDGELIWTLGLMLTNVAQAKLEGRQGIFVTDLPAIQSRRIRIMTMFPNFSLDTSAAMVHGTDLISRLGKKNGFDRA